MPSPLATPPPLPPFHYSYPINPTPPPSPFPIPLPLLLLLGTGCQEPLDGRWAGCDWRTIRHWDGGSKQTSPDPPSLQVVAATRAFSRSASAGAAIPCQPDRRIELQFQPLVGGLFGGHLDRSRTDDPIAQPSGRNKSLSTVANARFLAVTVASTRSEVSTAASAARSIKISLPAASARKARILANGAGW